MVTLPNVNSPNFPLPQVRPQPPGSGALPQLPLAMQGLPMQQVNAMPSFTQGNWLNRNSDLLGAIGMGLLQGQTAPQQVASAFAGMSNVKAGQKGVIEEYNKKVRDYAMQQRAAQMLSSSDPELAKMFGSGLLSGSDVSDIMKARASRAPTNPYMEINKRAFNWQTGQYEQVPGSASGMIDEDALKREGDLRKEYQGTQTHKDYQTIRSAYERIQASRERARTDTTGASDMAMIYSYMKMLDPTSVVRESEFASAAASGGYGPVIQNMVNRIMSGQLLTDGQRDEFMKTAEKIYRESFNDMMDLNDYYTRIARQYQSDPSRIVSSPEDYPTYGTTNRVMTPGKDF